MNVSYSEPVESRPGPSDAGWEERIWAYAAGLLDPDEARAVAWEVAGSPTARQRLREVREAFEEAARRTPWTLADARAAARARARSGFLGDLASSLQATVAQMNRLLAGSAGAVIHAVGTVVRKGDALMAEVVAGTLTFQPATATTLTTRDGSAPLAAGSMRPGPQAFRCPDGTELIISIQPNHEFQIRVRSTISSPDTIVSVSQVPPADVQEPTPLPRSLGKVARLDAQGRATLNHCPEGLLLVTIGEAKYVVALGTGPG